MVSIKLVYGYVCFLLQYSVVFSNFPNLKCLKFNRTKMEYFLDHSRVSNPKANIKTLIPTLKVLPMLIENQTLKGNIIEEFRKNLKYLLNMK